MVVVSLDMFLNNTQDAFVKYKNDKFCLIKGNRDSGKTISAIFKALYLKRNYCFDRNDKILFITSELESRNVVDIFNYINKSDLYISIIPSDDIEVHILTYSQFMKYKMGYFYTHVIIDRIEDLSTEDVKHVFSFFKNTSYSKVYLIQDSTENIQGVLESLEYLREMIKLREGIFGFRYVIDYGDRDEFTQISMMPDIKYLNYLYKEYIDFDTKDLKGYYVKDNQLYVDRGTFLYNVSNESMEVDSIFDNFVNENSICVLRDWVKCDISSLKFVEISDEGMGKYDLSRGDIVLIDTSVITNNQDVVVILRHGRPYARKIMQSGNSVKFVSDESIFSDIYLDDDVSILGKVVGYIR